jgi:hypothetical protein
VCPSDPPHFSGNSPDCTLEKCCLLHLGIGLLYSWGHLWASIKVLDVNEVAIIMIILGEPKHPNFSIIIASGLYSRNYHNNYGRAKASYFLMIITSGLHT